MAHVLIVDDEPAFCSLVAALLRERGHDPRCVSTGEAAILAVGERQPALVLLDLHLEGISGTETLRRLVSIAPDLPIVILTAFGNVEVAVHAMKLGATDFVTKPFNNKEFLNTIETLLALRHEVNAHLPNLIGESRPFREAMDLARKFAVPDINVLLLGETGTGKEFFARMIHAASKRRDGPFVAVDCSILAEGLIESELFGHEKGAFTGATAARIGRFERAQGGTLFLDEIGNLPVPFQAKLLRVLQERCLERVGGRESIQLDIRIVSATNVNLTEAIATRRFRQDLYYRLQEMVVELPPLRTRQGDIRRIAKHFVTRYSDKFQLSPRRISDSALEVLERYTWPGNVRELENVIKSAVVLTSEVVLPEHLPPAIHGNACADAAKGPISSNEHVEQETNLKVLGAKAAEQAERSLLISLLGLERMSASQLAKTLGVDPKTLRNKLRKYGLEAGHLTDD